MGGLGSLIGGMFNVEQLVKDKITDALENVAEEYGMSHKDFIFMIQPTDAEFHFKVVICKLENGAAKILRELTVRDIVGGDAEE